MFNIQSVLSDRGLMAAPYLLGLFFYFITIEHIAQQDISDLLGDGLNSRERWQTYIVPSAAGSIHAGTITLPNDVQHTASLPDGVGIQTANFHRPLAIYTKDQVSVNHSTALSPFIINADKAVHEKNIDKNHLIMNSVILSKRNGRLNVVPSFKSVSLYNPMTPSAMPRTNFLYIASIHKPMLDVSPSNKKVQRHMNAYNFLTRIKATIDAPKHQSKNIHAAKDTKAAHTHNKIIITAVDTPTLHATALAPATIDPQEKNEAQSAISKIIANDRQKKCLATAVYFEARGEDRNGQIAVAQVILNRVRNHVFPDTICNVVYQNKKWRNRCQFSFACDGIRERIRDKESWAISVEVAKNVILGTEFIPGLLKATHYHATYVRPRWARRMKQLKKIGRHIFYRGHNYGWG